MCGFWWSFQKKIFQTKKISVYLVFWWFSRFFEYFRNAKKIEFKKIEIFGNPITNSSFRVLMGLNHPVSERISSSGHFALFIAHITGVMRYFIHTEVVAQIFKIRQIQVQIFKFWTIFKKFVREGYMVNVKSVFALFLQIYCNFWKN